MPTMGIEPTTTSLKGLRSTNWARRAWSDKKSDNFSVRKKYYWIFIILLYEHLLDKVLLGAGFEPAHPKIMHLKCTALDHSANQAIDNL